MWLSWGWRWYLFIFVPTGLSSTGIHWTYGMNECLSICLSVSLCIGATRNMNKIGCNRGLVYGNLNPSDRRRGPRRIGLEPGGSWKEPEVENRRKQGRKSTLFQCHLPQMTRISRHFLTLPLLPLILYGYSEGPAAPLPQSRWSWQWPVWCREYIAVCHFPSTPSVESLCLSHLQVTIVSVLEVSVWNDIWNSLCSYRSYYPGEVNGCSEG